jgi:hypothetical protein
LLFRDCPSTSRLVGPAGLEPASRRYKRRALTLELRASGWPGRNRTGITTLSEARVATTLQAKNLVRQEGFAPPQPMAVALQATEALSRPADAWWYPRRDSNSHSTVSGTAASARLGYGGVWARRTSSTGGLWVHIPGIEPGLTVSKTVALPLGDMRVRL